LNRFGIEHESFSVWLQSTGLSFEAIDEGDVEQYVSDLREGGPVETLLERTTEEVFFLLFQNRRVLLDFNEMMAEQLRDELGASIVDPVENPEFVRHGVLRRVSIPAWAQRAIFFRDRGRCVFCQADLSGILSINGIEHVVPLARGGLNDVTNLQLLCRECNGAKHAEPGSTSDRYEAWYSLDED
jgi:hypothetical protein